MKNYLGKVTLVLLFGGLFTAFAIHAQDVPKNGEGFSINTKMSLKIALEKTEFVQLEPIDFRYSFINETSLPQTTIRPAILNDSTLTVDHDGVSKQYGELSIFRILLARQPVTFESGKGVEEEVTLETNLDKFFPRPGRYTIRLAITAPEGKLIESNSVEINVVEPTGIDKRAFEFIQQNKAHQKYPVLFQWKNEEQVEYSKVLLEEFVDKFSSSIYGDYAIYRLGNYYKATGQLDKARTEFEKLTCSKNARIVREARTTFPDVRKRICGEEK